MPSQYIFPVRRLSKILDLALLFIMLSAAAEQIAADPPAPVAATGQTTSYLVGDDGQYQAGVRWTSSRFIDNGDGTVTDSLTGLVWLKDAGCLGVQDWSASLAAASSLSDGVCDLTDRSAPGEWRLPNVLEMFSLVDLGEHTPALPVSNPFIGIVSEFHWTSTTLNNANARGRTLDVGFGNIDQSDKSNLHYVWPVRSRR